MEWISIENQLPEIGKTCLLYITYPKGSMMNCRADPLERTNIHIGGRLYNGNFSDLHNQFEYKELKYVTHWMPLPEPPKNKMNKDFLHQEIENVHKTTLLIIETLQLNKISTQTAISSMISIILGIADDRGFSIEIVNDMMDQAKVLYKKTHEK